MKGRRRYGVRILGIYMVCKVNDIRELLGKCVTGVYADRKGYYRTSVAQTGQVLRFQRMPRRLNTHVVT